MRDGAEVTRLPLQTGTIHVESPRTLVAATAAAFLPLGER